MGSAAGTSAAICCAAEKVPLVATDRLQWRLRSEMLLLAVSSYLVVGA